MKKSTNRVGSPPINLRSSYMNYRPMLLNWRALQLLPVSVGPTSFTSSGLLSIDKGPFACYRPTPKGERLLASRLIETLKQFLKDNPEFIPCMSSPMIKEMPPSAPSKPAGRKRQSAPAWMELDSMTLDTPGQPGTRLQARRLSSLKS